MNRQICRGEFVASPEELLWNRPDGGSAFQARVSGRGEMYRCSSWLVEVLLQEGVPVTTWLRISAEVLSRFAEAIAAQYCWISRTRSAAKPALSPIFSGVGSRLRS